MQEVSRGRHRKPMFPESEPRFVYAKDNRLGPDAPLVFLPEGEAETLRADCRDGHLWCPFPGCDLRFVTTRGGQRRHHFMHEREAVHSPETYFHMLGKHLLRQWARQRYPSAQVQMEAKLENGRIPDVLVSLNGCRFAFEIQYSALDPKTARERHEDYRARHHRHLAAGPSSSSPGERPAP